MFYFSLQPLRPPTAKSVSPFVKAETPVIKENHPATKASNGWLIGALTGAFAAWGSYSLMNLSRVTLPAAIATGNIPAIAVGGLAGLGGLYLGNLGARRGGSGENMINLGSGLLSLTAPVVAPAYTAFTRAVHFISTIIGMRHYLK